MTDKELIILINKTREYGLNIVQNYKEDKFENYLSLLATIIKKSETVYVSGSNSTKRIIENIKNEKIENYKLSLLEKFFYFKKYQYMFKENILTNKPEHIKKRFILEINEKLMNIIPR